MNAAVTGATGFLGRALLRVLLPQMRTVRVLVRRPEDSPAMRALGAEPVRGDLTLPGSYDGLIQPNDIIFHAAARVDMTGRWSDFAKVTVDGTRHLLHAALPCRPARFVYVSSASVYSPVHARRGSVSAERTPTTPARHNFYARAKLAAENAVRSECARAGCPWTIVRLGFLYGPGQHALHRHFVPLLQRRLLCVIGDGQNRIATLHVDDAARAVGLAGTQPLAAGRIYDVASDERVTQLEYLNATADALGLPRPARHAPFAVAYAAAGLVEALARVRRRPPPFTRAMVVLISVDQVVDARCIQEELGWRPEVSFREAMR